MNSRVTSFRTTIAAVVILFAGIAFGQAKKDVPPANSGTATVTNKMDEIYRDETHCLTVRILKEAKAEYAKLK